MTSYEYEHLTRLEKSKALKGIQATRITEALGRVDASPWMRRAIYRIIELAGYSHAAATLRAWGA